MNQAFLLEDEKELLAAIMCPDLYGKIEVGVRLKEFQGMGKRRPKMITLEQAAREEAASLLFGAYVRSLSNRTTRALLARLAALRELLAKAEAEAVQDTVVRDTAANPEGGA